MDQDLTDPRAEPKAAAGGAKRHEPAEPERERRSRVGGWALAAVFAVIALVAYIIRVALLPFVLAIAIAFVVEPVVRWVARRTRWRRGAAATLLAFLIVLLLAGAIYGLGSAALADLQHFAARAPQMAIQLTKALIGPKIMLFGETFTPKELVAKLGALLAAFLGTGTAMKIVANGMGAVVGGFLTLVLIPYFIISGPRLSRGAVWLLPPERRHSVVNLLPQIIPALRRYLAGVLGVVLYTATVAYIGFGAIFHLPYAVVLSVAVGILEMVPVAGPIVSAMLVAVSAFQEHSLTTVMFLGAFAIGLRLSIDNIVGPLLLGKAGRIHPVVVIFSFTCGAMLFGVLGLILAVPTAVCIRIVLQHYYAEPIKNRGRRS